jgi:predicted transcriptional regulator
MTEAVMSTTTIRIDEDLKARVALAAERAGKTAHGFILDAIARTVEDAELNDQFHQLADQRWERAQATGRAIAAEDLHSYLEARVRGERAKRPRARKILP